MKNTLKLLSCAALITVGATSCYVDPYAGGATHTTTTVYQPGYTVTQLPPRYVTETYGGVRYYRHGDVYYQSRGGRYIVVERPRGARAYGQQSFSDRGSRAARSNSNRGGAIMRRLPSGARVRDYRGVRYYESAGRYYRPADGGYIIVDRPY